MTIGTVVVVAAEGVVCASVVSFAEIEIIYCESDPSPPMYAWQR
jgi:hypothetical protein